MTISYPKLSQSVQRNLPALVREPLSLLSPYDDSSHDIFFCETVAGKMVLKICRHDVIEHSQFWCGINHLFAADFPQNLGQAAETYTLLRSVGTLAVPELIQAKAGQFVLTRFVAGQDMSPTLANQSSISDLAHHISHYHQYVHSLWGELLTPQFPAISWPERLMNTLLWLIQQNKISVPVTMMDDIRQRMEILTETHFVPVMLDLRWDQFRVMASGQLALIDLDAFVLAPPALELVLLEYVLTAEQFAQFKTIYKASIPWPDYELQRPCYQLLLFLMNVLGEQDLNKWMAHSINEPM